MNSSFSRISWALIPLLAIIAIGLIVLVFQILVTLFPIPLAPRYIAPPHLMSDVYLSLNETDKADDYAIVGFQNTYNYTRFKITLSFSHETRNNGKLIGERIRGPHYTQEITCESVYIN